MTTGDSERPDALDRKNPDDELLIELIQQADAMNDPVPPEAVAAAMIVPDLSNLDAELAELIEHEALTGVRSAGEVASTFRCGAAEIDVHRLTAGFPIEGSVYDLDVTAVALRCGSDRLGGEVAGHDFTIGSAPRGVCRLEFTTPAGLVATDWFVIA